MQSVRAFAFASIACLGLAACAQTGDFGRPQPGFWNDVALPVTGSLGARERGEPVSSFPFTDAEIELRDRSWRFLMPAHERAFFEALVSNLARTRILPASAHPSDPGAYYAALVAEPFRSPASRFRRIGEDAIADARLIGPFVAVAARVLAADRARLRSLPYVNELTGGEVEDASARVIENRCLIAWVRAELGQRTASYRYALEHAFLAMPQGQAAETERAIGGLTLHRTALEGLPLPAWRDGICVASSVESRVEERTIVRRVAKD